MNRLNKIVYIRHSSLLFLPFVGTLLYKLQNYLYDKGVVEILYISRKENPQKGKLIKKISSKADTVVCQSYKFGRILRPLEPTVVADFNAPAGFKNQPLEKLHEIAWTLILSDRVTQKTKKSFGDFLPETFPEAKI